MQALFVETLGALVFDTLPLVCSIVILKAMFVSELITGSGNHLRTPLLIHDGGLPRDPHLFSLYAFTPPTASCSCISLPLRDTRCFSTSFKYMQCEGTCFSPPLILCLLRARSHNATFHKSMPQLSLTFLSGTVPLTAQVETLLTFLRLRSLIAFAV